MNELLEKYVLIKGAPDELHADLAKHIVGLRQTNMGYEGLISSALLLGFTAIWLVLIINMNLFALEEKYHLERLRPFQVLCKLQKLI